MCQFYLVFQQRIVLQVILDRIGILQKHLRQQPVLGTVQSLAVRF